MISAFTAAHTVAGLVPTFPPQAAAMQYHLELPGGDVYVTVSRDDGRPLQEAGVSVSVTWVGAEVPLPVIAGVLP